MCYKCRCNNLSPLRKESFKNSATKTPSLKATQRIGIQYIKLCEPLSLLVFVAKYHVLGVDL